MVRIEIRYTYARSRVYSYLNEAYVHMIRRTCDFYKLKWNWNKYIFMPCMNTHCSSHSLKRSDRSFCISLISNEMPLSCNNRSIQRRQPHWTQPDRSTLTIPLSDTSTTFLSANKDANEKNPVKHKTLARKNVVSLTNRIDRTSNGVSCPRV